MKRGLDVLYDDPYKQSLKRARTLSRAKTLPQVMSSAMNVDTVSNAVIARKGKGRTNVKQRGRKLNKKQKQEVKRLIATRSELKFWGIQAANSVVPAPAAWVIGIVSAVPQGDTDSSRDGDRLMWCGTMEFNYQYVNGQAAGSDTMSNGRVLIIQWHPNSVPTVPNILLNGPSGSPDIYSVYNHDLRQQYTVLYDNHVYVVGNEQSAPNANITPSTGIIRVRLPTNKWAKQAQYAAGTTNGTNQIYIIYGSDTSAAGGARPVIAYSIKIFYRDS